MGSLISNNVEQDLDSPQPPYPLHPSVLPQLDPVYTQFYNKNIIHNQQVHYQSISASRSSPILLPGAGPPAAIGKTEDFTFHRRESDGPDVKVRVFTPEGNKPEEGWPLMIYFHGGGWVLGTIDTENVVCTRLCKGARCVVVSVDYRLAPENPFPAPIHDSWEALLWLRTTGHSLLSLNLSKSAIGGSSAGGNIAAVMTHLALKNPELVPNFKLQLLIVPVTDNTLLPSSSSNPTHSWTTNQYTPALPAAKMLWYRFHYLPSPSTHSSPLASPLLFPSHPTSSALSWAHLPDAFIVVGELDVLRDEGIDYGRKLEEAGREVDTRIMKGMPHPFLAMDGVLRQGRETIDGMVGALRRCFEG